MLQKHRVNGGGIHMCWVTGLNRTSVLLICDNIYTFETEQIKWPNQSPWIAMSMGITCLSDNHGNAPKQ